MQMHISDIEPLPNCAFFIAFMEHCPLLVHLHALKYKGTKYTASRVLSHAEAHVQK